MKKPLVLEHLKEKPVRYFKLLAQQFLNQKGYYAFTYFKESFSRHDRVMHLDKVYSMLNNDPNKMERIGKIFWVLEKHFPKDSWDYGTQTYWEIAEYLDIMFRERLENYLAKKMEELPEPAKEPKVRKWRSKMNKYQGVYKELVQRGFEPLEFHSLTEEFSDIPDKECYHVYWKPYNLFHPRRFTTEEQALKFQDTHGIEGITKVYPKKQ